jgi:hypothetical protein
MDCGIDFPFLCSRRPPVTAAVDHFPFGTCRHDPVGRAVCPRWVNGVIVAKATSTGPYGSLSINTSFLFSERELDQRPSRPIEGKQR